MSSGIVVYGATWCPDCRRSKAFLDAAGIEYENVDLEQTPEAVERVLELNDGRQTIPTIVFPDGTVLVEPTNAALAEKLGTSG